EIAKKAAAELAAQQAQAEAELEIIGANTPDTDQDKEEVAPGAEEEEVQKKKQSITQQIMRLGVAKKIEWANKKGNKEVRTILLRDPNKLVQLAVIQSPRITDG